MYFSIPAVLAMLAVSASATAIPGPSDTAAEFEIIQDSDASNIQKRNIGGVRIPPCFYGTLLLHNINTDANVVTNVLQVKICTDSNWKGTCGYAVQPLNQCISLDFPWVSQSPRRSILYMLSLIHFQYHSISSFGPDPQTACDWYR
jgi:hypothetical protein